jgi:pyruvate-formate lyase-activating enzyme
MNKIKPLVLMFPPIINIAVIRGKCPCKCIHCPLGVTVVDKRKKQFGNKTMNFKLFKKIVTEATLYKNTCIRIHGVGEPILWKNLNKAVFLLNEKKITSWLFTSLVTKNKKLLDDIAKNCSIIEVSVNSISKEDYKKTKGVDYFNIVFNNIKYLSNLIKKRNYNTRLIVSRVQTKDSYSDKKFVDFWKKSRFVDDVFVRSYHNYNGLLNVNKKKRKIIPCIVHWTRFNIDCNGDAPICFNELFKGQAVKKEIVLGNILGQKISEIWKGEKLNKIREAQLIGSYENINCSLPCIKCEYCQPLSNNRITSENQINQLGGRNVN